MSSPSHVTPVKPVVDVLTHVYHREVNLNSGDSLAKILAQIPPGSVVLDVGTGSGALGRFLHAAGGHIVDGVTYNAEEAALAQPYYRSVKTLDLERDGLLQTVGERRYDVVVCADVLEHLRNAGSVLRSMASLLKPNGCVLISVPNVAHLGVLLALMAGRFVRTREGLLDTTHVHFFDRVALMNLVKEAGFYVVREDAVVRNLINTEFAGFNFQVLPKSVRSFVASLADSSVYQFVWTLRTTSNSESVADQLAGQMPQIPTTPMIAQTAYFRSQLFIDRGNGFNEAECIDAFGIQTDALQVLRFGLAEGGGVRRIRLDLADRPGQLEFVRLSGLSLSEEIVWNWEGDWSSQLTYHQSEWTGVRGWLGGRVVRLTGDDPWVEFPLPEGEWAHVSIVELCISGPQPMNMSDAPGIDVTKIQCALQQLSIHAEERMRGLELQLDSARSDLERRQSDIDNLRQELQVAAKIADALQFKLNDTEIAHRQALDRLTQMTDHLDKVLTSWSWKITRGPRWLIRKLRSIIVKQ